MAPCPQHGARKRLPARFILEELVVHLPVGIGEGFTGAPEMLVDRGSGDSRARSPCAWHTPLLTRPLCVEGCCEVFEWACTLKDYGFSVSAATLGEWVGIGCGRVKDATRAIGRLAGTAESPFHRAPFSTSLDRGRGGPH